MCASSACVIVQWFSQSAGQPSAPVDVQKQYLSAVQHLLQEGVHVIPPTLMLKASCDKAELHIPLLPCVGLVSLIRAVQEAAEGVLIAYSLKHQLTCEGLLQLVSDIRLQTHPCHSPG